MPKPATWGKNPFYAPISETYISGKRKGQDKTYLTSGSMGWDLGGWHPKRRSGWANKPGNDKYVQKVEHVAPDGHKVSAYVTDGYDDYISFHAHTRGGMAFDKAIAQAEFAFSKEAHDKIEEGETDEGHIAKIRWTTKAKIMEVTFRDGAVCYFYKVPSAPAGYLIHALEAGNPVAYVDGNGVSRHQVGVIFWDLIRVRGQRHGAHYPFEYKKHSVYKVTGSSKRYLIKVTAENMEKIFGQSKNIPANVKPGSWITSALSEADYDKYTQAIDKDKAESTLGGFVQTKAYIDKEGDEVEAQLYDPRTSAANISNDALLQDTLNRIRQAYKKEHWSTERLMQVLEREDDWNGALTAAFLDNHRGATPEAKSDTYKPNGMLSDTEAARLAELRGLQQKNANVRTNKLMTDLERKVLEFRSENPFAVSNMADVIYGTNLDKDTQDRQFENALHEAAGTLTYNGKEIKVSDYFNHKDRLGGETLKSRFKSTSFGRDLQPDLAKEAQALARKENPAKSMSSHIGYVWTIPELIAMQENVGTPGHLSANDPETLNRYRTYMRQGRYDKMLDLLKNTSRGATSIANTENGYKTYDRTSSTTPRYAGQDDEIAYDNDEE